VMDKYKIILKTIFGSHLYGTNTEKSDKDYKVIYMPTKGEILSADSSLKHSRWEQTNPGASKNGKDDIDIEYIPLHKFIQLALKGDTLALDLLHVPNHMIEESNWIWNEIQMRREMFYTKRLDAFVGYARQQAAKYGIKGSRLDTCKKVMEVLDVEDRDLRVKDVWDKLPDIEHTERGVNKNGLREYQVCGRKIQETQTCEYAYDIVRRYYYNYGQRAVDASNNKNIDWKAVSHAIRAAYEVLSIYNEKTIKFPLKEAEYLKEVKSGTLDYLTEVGEKLESLMDEIEWKSKVVDLPEKTNREYWHLWLCKTIEQFYWEKL